MKHDARIFVAGHTGLVGSALLRHLRARSFTNILTATRAQLDLRDQAGVAYWFRVHRPEYVFLSAGTVGGIAANAARPAEFIYDNVMIHATVVHASYSFGVRKLLYLGSSCIYPRACPQPIHEDSLLSGPLESTNESYAIAKIAGVALCKAYFAQYGCHYVSAMPTNLYGPNDNFDLGEGHVLPCLIRKFHDARAQGVSTVTVWGSGRARREFLFVDDLADACVFVMQHYDDNVHINVGTGIDITIAGLAELVRDIVHPTATIVFDTTLPDGTPRKVLDVSRLHALGWCHRVDLAEGVKRTYEWFAANTPAVRGYHSSARANGGTPVVTQSAWPTTQPWV